MEAMQSQLPVFVNPTTLHFPLENVPAHVQPMTIFNPYDFTVRYKVLATAPNKYDVSQTAGLIRPKHYVDLNIRHLSVSANELGSTDLLRVEILREQEMMGYKDVHLCVVPHVSRPSEGTTFRNFPSSSGKSDVSSRRSTIATRRTNASSQRSEVAAQPHAHADNRLVTTILILVICCTLVAICLPIYDPNQTEPLPSDGFLGRFWPIENRPSVNQKLSAAVALGLSLMAFIMRLNNN